MRWPMRIQILLPFAAIQVAAIISIAALSAMFAVRQAENDIDRRLAEVQKTISRAWYPLTPEILDQLHRLSDAHFVVADNDGRTLASTVEESAPLRSSLASLTSQGMNSETDHTNVTALPVVHSSTESFYAASVRPGFRGTQSKAFVLFPVSVWTNARRQAMLPPLLVGVALLLVTTGASFWIAGRFSRRIDSVRQHVAAIATGNYQPASIGKTNDELRDLGLSVNRMASIVEQSIDSVRAAEQSRLLTQLVGGIAHQIRNALTGARTSIQLHQRHCQADRHDAIRAALNQLTLTEEQIKALLRLTRGESQPLRRAGINDILKETVALVQPVCIHRRIELSWQASPVDLLVNDGDALRGALLNLMMNAIDAVSQSGKIVLDCSTTDTHQIIAVRDTGPGLAASTDDIFQPFFTTKPEGAGLGLTLARRAAEDCGGDLSVHRENDMTVFTIRLLLNSPAVQFLPSTETKSMTTSDAHADRGASVS